MLNQITVKDSSPTKYKDWWVGLEELLLEVKRDIRHLISEKTKGEK